MNPPHLSALTFIRKLGGSYQARLFSAPDGSCFVAKAGDEDDHTKEEVTADGLYRAAWVDAPESWYVEDADDILWRHRGGRAGGREMMDAAFVELGQIGRLDELVHFFECECVA